MKNAWKRWGWPGLKGLLALVILSIIAHKFYVDLQHPDLKTLELRPGWLLVSAVMYVVALMPSAWYWHHLLHVFGDRPHVVASWRAYYIAQLGKYVPGKAVAVLMRAGLVRGPDVRFGVAVISTFYEVLATMAGGALLTAIIFSVDPPHLPLLPGHPMLTGLMLLAVCGIPLMPGVFNFVVARSARRFQNVDSFRLPPLRIGTLLTGLAVTMGGWMLQGLSLWAVLQAVLPEPPGLTGWVPCSAAIALACVAGFLVVFLPAALGVREAILLPLLAFAGPESLLPAAVLLLRLVWTATEVVLAGPLYLVRSPGTGGASPESLASPEGASYDSPGSELMRRR